MSYKIMLACAGGFSTSMLVTKMREAAESKGISVEIDAVAETDLDKFDDLDIILLGPQVGHLEESIKQQHSIPVITIDSLNYGMMDGEKVLEKALLLLEAR